MKNWTAMVFELNRAALDIGGGGALRMKKTGLREFYFYDPLKYPHAAAYGITWEKHVRRARACPVIPRPRIFAH